jgi:DNA/RNA endonuclease YhcR with UshA esterase domain
MTASDQRMTALALAAGVALTALFSFPALAETIRADQAQAHVGQEVTVEGAVSEVHTAASGRVTFIDFGGHYPNNAFTAVIFARDASKFPNVQALDGKVVDVTGTVSLYKGKPEIVLNNAAQIKAK